MKRKRVTVQDIADALGISRNTVSKALNNTGILSDATRKNILEKAEEMGYGRLPAYPKVQEASSAPVRELVLLTQAMPNASHFGSFLLNTFQEAISARHYKLSMYVIRETEVASLSLPLGLDVKKIHGIICIEQFDPAYTAMLSRLNVPILFVDGAADLDLSRLQGDFLLMENHHSIRSLTNALIASGRRRLAFAGNIHHCHSFFERYQGFLHALYDHSMEEWTRRLCTANGFTKDLVAALPSLPDAIICANDFVAIDLMKVLKECGIRVPEDVWITGFDDASESRIVEPHLTTVHIPGSDMGLMAADLLLSRIKNPSLPYRIAYAQTSLCFRASAPAGPGL